MNQKPEITIFTPTYNRAHLLSTTYQHLIQQTNTNFIWHIINDGSIDHTDEVVQGFIDEKKATHSLYKKIKWWKNGSIERICCRNHYTLLVLSR